MEATHRLREVMMSSGDPIMGEALCTGQQLYHLDSQWAITVFSARYVTMEGIGTSALIVG